MAFKRFLFLFVHLTKILCKNGQHTSKMQRLKQRNAKRVLPFEHTISQQLRTWVSKGLNIRFLLPCSTWEIE